MCVSLCGAEKRREMFIHERTNSAQNTAAKHQQKSKVKASIWSPSAVNLLNECESSIWATRGAKKMKTAAKQPKKENNAKVALTTQLNFLWTIRQRNFSCNYHNCIIFLSWNDPYTLKSYTVRSESWFFKSWFWIVGLAKVGHGKSWQSADICSYSPSIWITLIFGKSWKICQLFTKPTFWSYGIWIITNLDKISVIIEVCVSKFLLHLAFATKMSKISGHFVELIASKFVIIELNDNRSNWL